MDRQRWSSLLVALTMALAFAAIPAHRSGASAATPRRGGTLIMARTADIETWDPTIPNDNMSIWAHLLVFDQLVQSSNDGKGVVPGLATSWDVSKDGKVWTFHLRHNARFSDGTPVTAEDVRFSFDRQLKTAMNGYLARVDAVDTYTVRFTLKQLWAPFLSYLALWAYSIIPEHYFKKVGAAKFGNQPMGSGPFIMAKWEKLKQITLKRNPYYWKPGQPYLDEVDLVVIADDNTRMLKVQAGEIDIATDVPFNLIASLQANPQLNVQLTPLDRLDIIQMLVSKPQFSDVKVRQAMNYAVDKEAIIRAVLFGHGRVANSPLALQEFYDPTVPAYPYDLAKAKALMAASKYPHGFSATLLTVAGDTVFAQVAQIVKQELAQIGINISIIQQEGTTQFNTIMAKKYDMAQDYVTSDVVDPAENIPFEVISEPQGVAFYTNYKDPRVDQLNTEANLTLDNAKRQRLFSELQRQVMKDAPFIFLYNIPSRTALRKRVQNFVILPTGNYHLENVWLSQ